MLRDFRLIGANVGYPQSLAMPSLAVVFVIWLWLHSSGRGWATGMLMLIVGLAAWTLLEYLLHRFMLHGLEPFRGWHEQHHRQPDLPMRTPVLFSLMLLLALVLPPLLLPDAAAYTAAFSGGLILGHLLQETVHHRLHASPPPKTGWLRGRWLHHDVHHRRDQSINFGTLSDFWDRLFDSSSMA